MQEFDDPLVGRHSLCDALDVTIGKLVPLFKGANEAGGCLLRL